jgi:hypothetical protein
MLVDVPLRDPMSGKGGQPWRLPVWLSATCRLFIGDDAWTAANVEASHWDRLSLDETAP